MRPRDATAASAFANKMELKEEVIDLKARIKLIELRYKALVDALAKEGVIVSDELEENLNELIEDEDRDA